jgi:hypothetical protein
MLIAGFLFLMYDALDDKFSRKLVSIDESHSDADQQIKHSKRSRNKKEGKPGKKSSKKKK